MPKRNPPKTKPYAKYPPNVRRMLMQRDEKIEWLQQAIGRRESQLRYQRDQYDRLAAELAALKQGPRLRTQVSEPLPPVETKAGPTWMGVTKKVAATAPDPAPQAGAVVVKGTPSPLQLGAGYWNDWEGDRFDQRTYDPPPYEDTLPAMPAMTLDPEQVFNPTVAWSWWYWRPHHDSLTCPVVGDSPWPGVMYDNGLGEKTSAASWGMGGLGPSCCARRGYGWHVYPLPPATWRAA